MDIDIQVVKSLVMDELMKLFKQHGLADEGGLKNFDQILQISHERVISLFNNQITALKHSIYELKMGLQQEKHQRRDSIKDINDIAHEFDRQNKLKIDQMSQNQLLTKKAVQQIRQDINNHMQRIENLQFKVKFQLQLPSPFRNIQQKPEINLSKRKIVTAQILQRISDFSDTSSIARMLSSPSLIDEDSGYLRKFRVNVNTLQYIGSDTTVTQVFGNKIIDNDIMQYTFSISKAKDRGISIGLIDQKYIKQRDSTNSANCILYRGWSGSILEGGKQIRKQGNGLREKQSVVMKIDRDSISWVINKSVRAKHRSELLLLPSIKWVPFVQFYSKGDVAQFR